MALKVWEILRSSPLPLQHIPACMRTADSYSSASSPARNSLAKDDVRLGIPLGCIYYAGKEGRYALCSSFHGSTLVSSSCLACPSPPPHPCPSSLSPPLRSIISVLIPNPGLVALLRVNRDSSLAHSTISSAHTPSKVSSYTASLFGTSPAALLAETCQDGLLYLLWAVFHSGRTSRTTYLDPYVCLGAAVSTEPHLLIILLRHKHQTIQMLHMSYELW